MNTLDFALPLIWFGVIAFGVFMYVLMDGFVLGIGILFRGVSDPEERDIMMNSVAPIWDGNETWLVLGGAGLLAAFPIAYAVVLSALYLPLLLMLIALVFRGVAFEFRFKADRSRFLWDFSFNLGSLVATFTQGMVLGAFVQGLPLENGHYAGGPFDWVTPFSLMTGAGLVAGYGLLGSTWLIMKTEGNLQEWAYRMTLRLLIAVLVFIVIVSLWVPFLDPVFRERWFSWPNIVFLSPVPIFVAAVSFFLYLGVRERAEGLPFVLAMALFVLGYLGLAVSLWPNIIPPEISIWEAASPPESQLFLLVGVSFLIPIILVYTAYSYWVFRGKVRGDVSYH